MTPTTQSLTIGVVRRRAGIDAAYTYAGGEGAGFVMDDIRNLRAHCRAVGRWENQSDGRHLDECGIPYLGRMGVGGVLRRLAALCDRVCTTIGQVVCRPGVARSVPSNGGSRSARWPELASCPPIFCAWRWGCCTLRILYSSILELEVALGAETGHEPSRMEEPSDIGREVGRVESR